MAKNALNNQDIQIHNYVYFFYILLAYNYF